MPTPRTASSLRLTKQCSSCGSQYVARMLFCPRDGQKLEDIPDPAEDTYLPGSAPSGNISESDATDALLGRTIADHYKLVAKIGQGGMGAVYKAEHVRITRPSAIKILNPEYAGNPEFVARFGREAELASRINHPNAVGIYDVGEEEDGLVYIAMEYVDGELLSKILKREGPLALDRAVTITRQVADALEVAHELDIVHRDLKPENIMICKRRGKCDWVKVVDFGIAKRAHHGIGYQNLTRKGFVLGTPEYMAPEQLLREPLDIRSDIYSLGLVVYRMLTGKLPFEGPTPQVRMIKKLTEPPLGLRSAAPGLRVSPQVEAVIMKALARDRKTRYSSSTEFAAALESAAQSNAVYAVLAGNESEPWDFDEAETQESEAPINYSSSATLSIEDAVKGFQSLSPQPESPQQPSPQPPPAPVYPPPAPKPPAYRADSYETPESRLDDSLRPKGVDAPPAIEPMQATPQQVMSPPPRPVYQPAPEQPSIPPSIPPSLPPSMPPQVYDPGREASFPPGAPPMYNQPLPSQPPYPPYGSGPEKGLFQPASSGNWGIYAAVSVLVVIVVLLILILAMWLSGTRPTF